MAKRAIDQLKTDLAIYKDKEDRKKINRSTLINLAAPALIGTQVVRGANRLSAAPVKKFFTEDKNKGYTAAEAAQAVKNYAKAGKVDLSNTRHNGQMGEKSFGPHYNPAMKHVNTGMEGGRTIHRDYGDFIMAHEVGHAMDFQKHPNQAYARSVGLGRLAPIAGSVAVSSLNRQHIRDKFRRLDKGNEQGKWHKAMNFAEKHPYITGASLGTLGGLATALPSEAIADINAYKIMKQTMPKQEALHKALSGSARQLSNYALVTGTRGAATGALVAGLTRHSEEVAKLRDKHRQQEDSSKKIVKKAATFAQEAKRTLNEVGVGNESAGWVLGSLGAGIGMAAGASRAEKKSQQIRLKTFGPPPRFKDFGNKTDFERAQNQYERRVATEAAPGDSLKNYYGTIAKGTALGGAIGGTIGHLGMKQIYKHAATTLQDNPHAQDFHDKYQGFDDAKTVAKRRLKYQVGGAALGAGATLLGLPALSYGTAHLAKAVGRQKRWDGYGIMYKGRSSNNVDPKEEFRNAIPENKLMAGLGGAFTGMSVGGGVADSIQKKRDNKVIAQRYADRSDLKDIALNSHIDVAEAIKQLGLKKKGTR